MRGLAAMVLTGLAACGAPSGQVAVTPDGQAAGRVSSGNVTVAGGPSGPAAAVRVIDTASTDVTVGTGGATASVAPRGLPVRVGLGRGGIRLGF